MISDDNIRQNVNIVWGEHNIHTLIQRLERGYKRACAYSYETWNLVFLTMDLKAS